MNDRDCESCKMHEFTLHSATKYDDGTPMTSKPEKAYCDTDSVTACKSELNSAYGTVLKDKDWASSYPTSLFKGSNQLDPDYCKFGTCPYYDKFCDHTLQDKHGCAYLPHDIAADIKYLEQTFTEFAKTQDDLIEEYDATLKTHGDTLEQHMERITINEGNIDAISSELEDLQRKVAAFYQFINTAAPGTFFKIIEELKRVEKENVHNGSNFCGNCTHSNLIDGICTCRLNKGIIDPDDSSCEWFEPPYESNPEGFDNMKEAMTTPSEPSVGCVDCKYARKGMCEKYNCSLGVICATPECHESFPF